MRGPCNALPRLVAALVLCAAWLLRAAQLASSQARVVQGRVAAIEDFAHGAVLLSGGRQWCGAVLLGPRHALTAAHCLDERCANITAHTRCPAAPPPKRLSVWSMPAPQPAVAHVRASLRHAWRATDRPSHLPPSCPSMDPQTPSARVRASLRPLQAERGYCAVARAFAGKWRWHGGRGRHRWESGALGAAGRGQDAPGAPVQRGWQERDRHPRGSDVLKSML